MINSTEGETVQRDSRRVVSLPSTDNVALAVVDDEHRLTSLIIATLLPAGQGGSIVTVPVMADSNNGFGEMRAPLDGLLDPDDPTAFFQQVEETLALSLQFGEIVGSARLTELLDPVLPVDAVLPVDVIDADADADADEEADEEAGADADESSVAAGDIELTAALMASVLQSVDDDATERERHAIDVAVWTAAAANSPADGAAVVPRDSVDRPVTSETVDELFARLWSGPVQVRDLSLLSPPPPGSDNAVVLDRRDVVLVFAQISPARVSAPNPGPVFRVEIPISDAQFDGVDSELGSRRDVGLNLIGRLFFLEANTTSVDATPNPDGAPAITRIEVANADSVATMEELGPLVFGEVEVVVAEELIDGIDVVVRLGTGYLDAHATVVDAAGGSGVGPSGSVPDASTPQDDATVGADG